MDILYGIANFLIYFSAPIFVIICIPAILITLSRNKKFANQVIKEKAEQAKKDDVYRKESLELMKEIRDLLKR